MQTESAALREFRSRFCGAKIDVIGVGVSHLPLLDMLLSVGAVLTARDRSPRGKFGEEAARSLEEKGIRTVFGPGYLDGIDGETVFRSPGVRPDVPQLARAREEGRKVICETDLFLELCPYKTIGITGSNGKTTTSTLTAAFLEASGKKVFLGGNIGRPLLPRLGEMSEADFAVIELSSFQLTGAEHSPAVAVITNLSPNHLDWHVDMDEYIEAKKAIFRNPENRRLVLNFRDPLTRALAEEASQREVEWFASDALHGGYYAENGVLFHNGEKLFSRGDILLRGDHNVENVLAALAATKDFADPEKARDFVRGFRGVEHRLEFVREKDGVTYINSSIDSSPSRTEAALSVFSDRVIVICGGYDKHIPFSPLGRPLCEKARVLILTGQTAPKIREAVLSCPEFDPEKTEIVDASDLSDAVKIASEKAKKGEVVLLSPASASFDAFRNFEERGRFFKEAVFRL